jgi:hypothetical protein
MTMTSVLAVSAVSTKSAPGVAPAIKSDCNFSNWQQQEGAGTRNVPDLDDLNVDEIRARLHAQRYTTYFLPP